jgi:hypothetical protein
MFKYDVDVRVLHILHVVIHGPFFIFFGFTNTS